MPVTWYRVSQDAPDLGALVGDRVVEIGRSSRLVRSLGLPGVEALRPFLVREDEPPDGTKGRSWADRVRWARGDVPYAYGFVLRTLLTIAPGSQPPGLGGYDVPAQVDRLSAAGRSLVSAVLHYADALGNLLSELVADAPDGAEARKDRRWAEKELRRTLAVKALLREILRLPPAAEEGTCPPGLQDHQEAVRQLLGKHAREPGCRAF